VARHRLVNEAWGFDSNCFVCEPKNPTGLRISFEHDDEAGSIVATFTLGPEFSGAPRYVHGGITLAVLDEAQAWATIALGGKFALTVETSTRFEQPVLVGKTYTVEARVLEQTEDSIATEADVLRANGSVCARGTATFAVLGPAAAADAIGTELPADLDDYLGR